VRVALYARTSTRDGRQHLSNQFVQLKAYARRMKWTIAKSFSDTESGAHESRPGLDAMLKAAAGHEFDAVVAVDLSRITRGGIAKAFEFLARLANNHVEFWSMREEMFRTTGPAGKLFIAIAAHVAEIERHMLRERIKAGIDRARANGVRLGPPARVIDLKTIQQLKAEGYSLRKIAKVVGVSHETIARRLHHATKTENANAAAGRAPRVRPD
jgi:DNA invertase Pin-like site-specific DNA recombinase